MNEKFSAEQLDAVAELILHSNSYKNAYLLTAICTSIKMKQLMEGILNNFYSEITIDTDESQISVNTKRLLISGILLGYAVRQVLTESPKVVS